MKPILENDVKGGNPPNNSQSTPPPARPMDTQQQLWGMPGNGGGSQSRTDTKHNARIAHVTDVVAPNVPFANRTINLSMLLP